MHEPIPPGRADGRPSADLVLLMTTWTAGVAAAVASFSALLGLARIAGWNPDLAWLLPLTVDAYALGSLRLWLAKSTQSTTARHRARRNAVLAILASVAGNATYHAAAAHVFVITWPVVVAVSATPPVVLGLVSHLLALHAMPADVPRPPDWRQVPKRELPAAELLALPKAEAIRIALAHTEGGVMAACGWLAERGVTVDRRYAHTVKAGGWRRSRRSLPAQLSAAPDVAA